MLEQASIVHLSEGWEDQSTVNAGKIAATLEADGNLEFQYSATVTKNWSRL